MSLEARLRKLEKDVGEPAAEACGCGFSGIVLESELDAVRRGKCPRCGRALREGFACVVLPNLAEDV